METEKMHSKYYFPDRAKCRRNSLKIRQRMGHKCQLCGERQDNDRGVSNLHVHHIDRKKINHDLPNLLVVCMDCHGALHRKVNPCPDYNCKHWDAFVDKRGKK